MARRYQNDAERLRKQSDALSKFGGHALRTDDLDALLQEATELVSEAIEIDLVKVLQLLPDGETMLLRAGVNWKRSEEHTSELQSLMRISYAVFCLKKKKK